MVAVNGRGWNIGMTIKAKSFAVTGILSAIPILVGLDATAVLDERGGSQKDFGDQC